MTKAGLLTGKGERRGVVTKHNRWQLSAAIWGALTNPRDRLGRSGLRVGGGGLRTRCSCAPGSEDPGGGYPPARPWECGVRRLAALPAPHPAGLPPPRQVAAGRVPRRGLHGAGEASRWLSSVLCRLPAPGCAQEGPPPWDTDLTKLPGRCY